MANECKLAEAIAVSSNPVPSEILKGADQVVKNRLEEYLSDTGLTSSVSIEMLSVNQVLGNYAVDFVYRDTNDASVKTESIVVVEGTDELIEGDA